MAVTGSDHRPPASRLGTKENCRRDATKRVLLWESPMMYPTRCARNADGGFESAVTLRTVAESFLNLEQRMKIWGRHICRRLDRIEYRLTRCESVLPPVWRQTLSLLATAGIKTSTAMAKTRTPLRCANLRVNNRHEDASGFSEEPRTACEEGTGCLHARVVLKALDDMAKECSCHTVSSPVAGPDTIRKQDKEAKCALKRCFCDAGALSGAGGVVPVYRDSPCAVKGMLSPSVATTIRSGESVGLTPGSVEEADVVSVVDDVRCGGDRGQCDFESVRRWDSYHPGPMCGLSSPMPPFAAPPSTASGLTASNTTGRTTSCGWSPLIQEPCKPGNITVRGAKAAAVELPSDVPDLRVGLSSFSAKKTGAMRMSTQEDDTCESRYGQFLSPRRRLIYSPDDTDGVGGQVSSMSSHYSVPKTPSPCPKENFIELCVKHDLKQSPHGFSTAPVSNLKTSNSHSEHADACLPPQCVQFSNSAAGVLSTLPLYVVPQRLYRGSGDGGDCDDDEKRSGEKTTAPPSPPTAAGGAWRTAVALAHAGQRGEGACGPPGRSLSAPSSGLLEVSASTASVV